MPQPHCIQYSIFTKYFLTNGNNVMALGTAHEMNSCTIEEADTHVAVHILDAIENGFNRLCIRTVDSDLVYIIISHLDRLLGMNHELTIAVAFDTGKNYLLLDINVMAFSLSKELRHALSAFHAFSGCDIASFFFKKGKATFWKKSKPFPDVLQANPHIDTFKLQIIKLFNFHT